MTETLKLAMAKGTNSFSISSGSVSLMPYNYAYLYPKSSHRGLIRVSLYESEEAARKSHGDEIRKISASKGSSQSALAAVAGVEEKLYKSLSGSTNLILGAARKPNFNFRATPVEAILISTSEQSTTYDLDLTSEPVASLIKEALVPARTKTAVIAKAKPASSPAAKAKKVEEMVPAVKPTLSRINSITFKAGTTVADLRNMGFSVMIADADNNPFSVEIK